MNPHELAPEERLTAGDVIAEMSSLAPQVGANTSSWQGLTLYRFIEPQAPVDDSVGSLSLCFVVQGRKRLDIGDQTFRYDPFNYFVFTRGMRFRAEILEASIEKPFLSFVLQIDPGLVRRVSSDMVERSAAPFRRSRPADERPDGYVSPVDQNIMGAVLRFLRSTRSGADRRVLAPMYLQEIVYRVLQTEKCDLLLQSAAAEHASNPISAVVAYIQDNLAEPLTVAELADRAFLSPSAFAHLFRDVTGLSPYQFVKKVRLDRARSALIESNLNVSDVARAVGYSSLSHFINEFKQHFGITPKAFADVQRLPVPLGVDRATRRVQ